MSLTFGIEKLTDAKSKSAWGWYSLGPKMKFSHLDFPHLSVGPLLETG